MVELADYLPDDSSPDGGTYVLDQENKIELYQAIHHLQCSYDESDRQYHFELAKLPKNVG